MSNGHSKTKPNAYEALFQAKKLADGNLTRADNTRPTLHGRLCRRELLALFLCHWLILF
jgi:hypothetical protein